MITLDKLKEILFYDHETGIFTWLISVAHRVSIGDEAGYLHSSGYRIIYIKGEQYRTHRLAWFYMTGDWPKGEIDHINMIRNDNRWNNLRDATHSQNNHNRKKYSRNTSGFKGVCWHKITKKYSARIRINKKSIALGYYDCPAAAYFETIIARDKFHGNFAHN